MHLDEVLKRKSLLFLKKKKQKDFSRFSPEMVPGPENRKKFFGSFFQERTAFVAHRAKGPGKVHNMLQAPARQATDSIGRAMAGYRVLGSRGNLARIFGAPGVG